MHARYHWLVTATLVSLFLFGAIAAAAPEEVDHTDPTVKDGRFSMTEVYLSVGLAASAGITAGVSILGAGAAVGKIGAAALGSAAEHPELLTRSLLFVALAEGLAVLGFAVAMLIVMRIP